MKKGKIILLNGVSSSGKSTLAKALQDRYPDVLFRLALDMVSDIVPERFKPHPPTPDEVDPKIIHSAYYNCIKVFSDLGLNVVADSLYLKDVMPLDKCLYLLHDYPILFVHVTCPLDELRRREKERGDRRIGQGEGQLPRLDPQDTYDITIDTFNESKEACADKIIELLEHMQNHTAFKTLWLQRSK